MATLVNVRRSLLAAVTGVALLASMAAPAAFAAGGGTGGGGTGGGGVNAGGANSGGASAGGGTHSSTPACVKVSGQAVEAFSYYTMLTLSSTVDNCSTSSISGTVKFDASSASPACASEISNTLPIKFSLLPGTRAQVSTAVFASGCAVGEPITVTVAANNDQQLGTAVATWTSGVTP